MFSCRIADFAVKTYDKSVDSGTYRALGSIVGLAIALAVPPAVQAQARSLLSLDQAVDLALEHNHSLKAARTQILQNQAQEVTAGLRPNPTLSGDSQFLPLFNPGDFNSETLDQISQFDLGIGYLWERGGKRKRRLEAARDQTALARLQIADNERSTVFSVSQQFIAALLAKANVDLASRNLESFKRTADIADYQFKVGQISEGDALKIRLQTLQFQSDLSSAKLSRVQAMTSLRQLLGYDAVPEDFELEGDLKFQPLAAGLEDLQALALNQRSDLLAAKQGIVASLSQHKLAVANGKRDLTTSFNYSHVADTSSASLFFNIELPIFDRNQGEKARTQYAVTQAQETSAQTLDTVMTDVRNAYEALKVNQQIVEMYESGYLKNSQDSRVISEYAYKKGAASLLDYLDAERSYRAVQLAYQQALAAHMLALEQLKQAVGTRRLP